MCIHHSKRYSAAVTRNSQHHAQESHIDSSSFHYSMTALSNCRLSFLEHHQHSLVLTYKKLFHSGLPKYESYCHTTVTKVHGTLYPTLWFVMQKDRCWVYQVSLKLGVDYRASENRWWLLQYQMELPRNDACWDLESHESSFCSYKITTEKQYGFVLFLSLWPLFLSLHVRKVRGGKHCRTDT